MAICPHGHESASDDFCDICPCAWPGAPAQEREVPVAPGTWRPAVTLRTPRLRPVSAPWRPPSSQPPAHCGSWTAITVHGS